MDNVPKYNILSMLLVGDVEYSKVIVEKIYT